ncbi:hypothetical protein PHLGIDRAFT_35298 [Phlebiopsis gigantea 11061_1 CR5-6]|uniref:Uncharacterized protein n=1 Tax=Phlebiopsis gigantea (strain 11061_1 CR5-6) TaxID=745531 RepID=A0A0C3RZI3_PHLG1|nr:hypothetical protein PHLGIDRAFT_35298 [Phlebiopsis gigantea 11061_1 CR5-6]
MFKAAALRVSVLVGLLLTAQASPIAADIPTVERTYKIGRDGAPSIPSTTAVKMTRQNLEQKRVGGVYACEDTHWSGSCDHAELVFGQCNNLPDRWDKEWSSFGPDQCTNCTAYS